MGVSGGFVAVKDGGVGFTYVDLQLHSQSSNGFQFLVSVYAKHHHSPHKTNV